MSPTAVGSQGDNSTRGFNDLGFEAVREEDVFCTASVAALYLREILKLEGKVYLLGVGGMQEELQKAGLEFIGHGIWSYITHMQSMPHTWFSK